MEVGASMNWHGPNGFRINDKLQVGFALSYAFGHIEDQRVTSLHNNSSVSQLLPIISQENIHIGNKNYS